MNQSENQKVCIKYLQLTYKNGKTHFLLWTLDNKNSLKKFGPSKSKKTWDVYIAIKI